MFPMVSSLNPFAPSRPRRTSQSGDEDMASSLSSSSSSSISEDRPAPSEPEPEPFYPTLNDVLKARYILRWKLVPDGLPVEIVDIIVDAAEYWPSAVSRLEHGVMIAADHDRILLVSPPLCYDESSKMLPHRTVHPCRKIVFNISSHDQGWGGSPVEENPFLNSFTWFDTETFPLDKRPETKPTERPDRMHFGPDDPRLLPRDDRLVCNATAKSRTQHHKVIWRYLDDTSPDSEEALEAEHSEGRGKATLDGRRVREMQVGDSIAIWGRARFGGWSNHVERMSVRVFWSV